MLVHLIRMERYLRTVEGHQQLGLVGVQPSEQPVEGGEAGSASEDAVEAGAQGGFSLPGGMAVPP